MPAHDPNHRKLCGVIGAHALHAQGKTNTLPARTAFLEKFEHDVDPDGLLPVEERLRRAEHARKAHFAKMALKSAQARRLRSGGAPDAA